MILAYLNKYDSGHRVTKKIFQALRDERLQIQISSVSFLPLLPDTALTANYLRRDHDLGFFDSHYAALASDRKIVSFDRAYNRVEGLERIPPEDIPARVSSK